MYFIALTELHQLMPIIIIIINIIIIIIIIIKHLRSVVRLGFNNIAFPHDLTA
jgi:hypothetical protein